MSTPFTFKRSDMNERNYELLEPGQYVFEIVKAFETDMVGDPLVSRKGTAYLKLICQEITTEVTIFHYLFLDSDQAAKVSAFLAAIGYDFEDGQEIQLSADTFKGHLFSGRVENAPGKDGIVRNKITRVSIPPKEEEPEDGDVELEVTDAPGLEGLVEELESVGLNPIVVDEDTDLSKISMPEPEVTDAPGLEDDDARGAMPTHLVANEDKEEEEEEDQVPF